jgi:hypothetical protein
VFDLFKNDASVFYNNSVSRFCLVFYSWNKFYLLSHSNSLLEKISILRKK